MDQFSIGKEPGLSFTDHLGDMCILLAHNFPPLILRSNFRGKGNTNYLYDQKKVFNISDFIELMKMVFRC